MYFSELHQGLLQFSIIMKRQKGNTIICIFSRKKKNIKNKKKYKSEKKLGPIYLAFQYAEMCRDVSFITVLWPQQQSSGHMIKT